DEFGDEAELEQIIVGDMGEQLVRALAAAETAFGAEANAHVVAGEALLDVVLEPFEGTATDEQDVGGIDLKEVLVRVLPAALWRHVRHAPFDDLEERLLDALAGDIPRDAGVVALARDLVDLVDVDDPPFGLLDVEVGGLDEVEEDVLDIFADVSRLGEGR